MSSYKQCSRSPLHRGRRHGHDPGAAGDASLLHPEAPDGFESVHARHLHVHEDRVTLTRAGLLDCLGATACHHHVMPRLLQPADRDNLIHLAVVHQQGLERTGVLGDLARAMAVFRRSGISSREGVQDGVEQSGRREGLGNPAVREVATLLPLPLRCISKLLVILPDYRVLAMVALGRGHGNRAVRATDIGDGDGVAGGLD